MLVPCKAKQRVSKGAHTQSDMDFHDPHGDEAATFPTHQHKMIGEIRTEFEPTRTSAATTTIAQCQQSTAKRSGETKFRASERATGAYVCLHRHR